MADTEVRGRRAFLKGATASTLAAGLATLAVPALAAATESAVMRLYREREAMIAHIDDDATPSAECDRLYPVLTALQWSIAREPAVNMVDVAAKVLALTTLRNEESTIFDPDLLAELEAIVAG